MDGIYGDNTALTNMTAMAHRLLAEVVRPGDCAIDLTVGRGHDTLWLAGQVDAGNGGMVLGFDIQRQAITSSAERLENGGFPVRIIDEQQGLVAPQGATLYHGCHSNLARLINNGVVPEPKGGKAARGATGIIANFGYLPGADHAVTTTAANSCRAVEQAATILAPKGRIALVIYTGHAGAMEEAEAVEELCQRLDSRCWNILRLQPVNRNNAPYLLVLEKRAITGTC